MISLKTTTLSARVGEAENASRRFKRAKSDLRRTNPAQTSRKRGAPVHDDVLSRNEAVAESSDSEGTAANVFGAQRSRRFTVRSAAGVEPRAGAPLGRIVEGA